MNSKVFTFLHFIRIEHTIFDLPFVFVGIIFAIRNVELQFGLILKILIIVTAAILARISGMTINRLIDLPFDRLNPRTQKRELVTGEIKIKTAYLTFIFSSLIFIIIAFYLNILAGLLSPFVLLSFYLYPKTKKLPFLSHFFLGISIGLIVLAGYIGVKGNFPLGWSLYGYSVFISLWIAAFDIIYQNQDREFDKTVGIKSIPVLLEGRIKWVLICLNLVSSIILLSAALYFPVIIVNLLISSLLIGSSFFIEKYDVDRMFKTFYLPVPFLILFSFLCKC